MLVIFKSKSAADVVMYAEHAQLILDLLHKDVKRGVITAAESGEAIATLEREIAAGASSQASNTEASPSPLDQEEPASHHVSFATRVYPLLEMLRASHKRDSDVMWGV